MGSRDWSLCFICQSADSKINNMDPSSSVVLRNNPERLSACYKQVTDNIRELNELGELPDFVFVDSIGGESGDGDHDIDLVKLMMSKQVVWHKTCRSAVDNQKLERARNKHEEQEAVSPVKTRRMNNGVRSTSQHDKCSPSTVSNETLDTPCIFCGRAKYRWTS